MFWSLCFLWEWTVNELWILHYIKYFSRVICKNKKLSFLHYLWLYCFLSLEIAKGRWLVTGTSFDCLLVCMQLNFKYPLWSIIHKQKKKKLLFTCDFFPLKHTSRPQTTRVCAKQHVGHTAELDTTWAIPLSDLIKSHYCYIFHFRLHNEYRRPFQHLLHPFLFTYIPQLLLFRIVPRSMVRCCWCGYSIKLHTRHLGKHQCDRETHSGFARLLHVAAPHLQPGIVGPPLSAHPAGRQHRFLDRATFKPFNLSTSRLPFIFLQHHQLKRSGTDKHPEVLPGMYLSIL